MIVLSKTSRALIVPLVATGLSISANIESANAQSTSPPNATPQSGAQQGTAAQTNAAGRSLFQSAMTAAYSTSTAANRRLAPLPVSTALSPLGYLGSAQVMNAAAALETPGAPETAALWNAWIDAQTSYSRWEDPVAGYDGPLSTVTFGADRAIGARGLIGVIVSGERADLDTRENAGALESRGAGAGLYGGLLIGDTIVADALVLWKDLRNDVSASPSRGTFDSTRWQATANLTGYFYNGAFRISPNAGLSWAREQQDGYSDSQGFSYSARTLKAATATAGLQVGYTVYGADGGATYEPWLGVAGDLEVQREDVAANADQLSRFDMRIGAGLNAQLSDAVVFNLTGEAGGLVRSNYETYRVGAQIAVKF